MKFINPGFLVALTAISIPIIVHLFNFRRYRKYYFTNVRFLKNIQHQTQSASRLKHILVLLTRIGAVSALVFAFAQPYIPTDDSLIATEENSVSVYLDNSFSMDAINSQGRLMDIAKKNATDIANYYKATDRFQLLTNDFEGRHQRLVNNSNFNDLVQEVDVSPNVKDVSEVIKRQTDLLNDVSGNKIIYLISDFQKNISDFAAVKADSNVSVYLVPVTPVETANLYIDSCWFATPVRQVNEPSELTVSIKNNSDNKFEDIPVRLIINGKQKALASFRIEPYGTAEVKLPFTPTETGIQQGALSINDYPITYDDKLYISFEVAESIPVLAINGEKQSNYLNALFNSEPFFRFTNMLSDQIDYSSLAMNRLIILNGLNEISSGLARELERYVENGGNLLVFPGKKIDLESYREFTLLLNADHYTSLDTNDTRVGEINTEHFIYNDVFEEIPENINLPQVRDHYLLSNLVKTNKEDLLELENKDPFLSVYSYGKGRLYLGVVGLEDSFGNFARHALFVPTLYKVTLYSIPSSRLYYTIGRDEMVETTHNLASGENVFKVSRTEEDFEVIPEHRVIDSKTYVFLHHTIEEAGNYILSSADDTVTGLAFNYERAESDLRHFAPEELEELAAASNMKMIESNTAAFDKRLADIASGKKLWRLFIILALVFLAIEVLLLRAWKPEKVKFT